MDVIMIFYAGIKVKPFYQKWHLVIKLIQLPYEHSWLILKYIPERKKVNYIHITNVMYNDYMAFTTNYSHGVVWYQIIYLS